MEKEKLTNNYLIEFNGDYGIYQSDKTKDEVKMLFNENAKISQWDSVEEAQKYSFDYNLNYIGFDMFYR